MSTFYTYGKLPQHLLQAEIDILNDTVKCMLLNSTASIDQDTNDITHDFQFLPADPLNDVILTDTSPIDDSPGFMLISVLFVLPTIAILCRRRQINS